MSLVPSSPCAPADAGELLSPGLANRVLLGAAYELKFPLKLAEADAFDAWARENMTPDVHGLAGTYRVLSIYHDTPHLDVFHRSEGFRRSKFRLRRYDEGTTLFLERKTRSGDQVRKRRVEIAAEELDGLGVPELPAEWGGAWFGRRLRKRDLRPTSRVTYLRTAFFGQSSHGPIRLTIDRELMGALTTAWDVSPLRGGTPLLPGGALLEMKFHVHVPALFQELLARLPSQPPRMSKYRRSVELSDLATQKLPSAHIGSNGVAH